MIRTYSILFAATLFVLSSSLGNSGTITDATGNTSFDSARNIDQGFTIGAKQDVGTTTYTGNDWVKGPNSTIVPWVSIENPKAWGQVDFFSFTVGSNSKVWVDVDYGYQTPVSSAPLQTDYDTQLTIYNSQKIDITAISSFFGNNADATLGGVRKHVLW
jgi:hypothetical protein